MRTIIMQRAERIAAVCGVIPEKIKQLSENLSAGWAMPVLTKDSVAAMIDHTLLSFDAEADGVRRLCEEAAFNNFFAVCVNPVWVAEAVRLRNYFKAQYKVASVIDFPLGASTTVSRAAETRSALDAGADEIDIVIGIGLLKSGDYKAVYEGLTAAQACGGYHKVILETSALTLENKIDAALIALFADAHMLKTSTGVNGKATIEDVELLRAIAGKKLGVKAAGGIRDRAALELMVRAGADRIGSSSSVKIVGEYT